MSPRIYSEGQIELDYTKNGLGRILGRFAFWIATGHTDMRRGMQSLVLTVQESLKRDPHAGDLYIFRGRRGDLVKILWHDGIGVPIALSTMADAPRVTNARQRSSGDTQS